MQEIYSSRADGDHAAITAHAKPTELVVPQTLAIAMQNTYSNDEQCNKDVRRSCAEFVKRPCNDRLQQFRKSSGLKSRNLWTEKPMRSNEHHELSANGGCMSKSTLIPTSYTSPARPPYIHKKNKKQFSQKYVQKTIISRINFIQTCPTNYSTKLSRFFLCLLDTMCLVHPHFLTVHLQTSHSISI